jgi:predicted AlkP superfamily pyrophosphatase or phosphodiesterase
MVTRAARLLVGALLLCAACGAAGPSVRPGPRVILISLDGTRPQDVVDDALPAFAEVLRRGARAERLVPAFPANTFPNHVTLVTGVAPEVHGIVNNVFFDPQRGRFDYDADPDWILVEPVWSIAARYGVVSASFHWVGSEGPWHGAHGPRHWKKFDSRTQEDAKVRQILAWLDIPDASQRPRLITAWFHGADHAGHVHGPGSDAVRGAMREQDAALAVLLAGLAARDAWASTTLLLVSDHGMAAIRERVDLQAALGDAGVGARVVGGGGFAAISADDEDAARRAVAVARELGLESWLRREAPQELRVSHPRFGAAVVLAPPGTSIESRRAGRDPLLGAHGYRPELPAMGALLLALGRGAEPGERLGEVRSIDVAPTVLSLLGVPPPQWMEGRAIPALLPRSALP